MQCHKENYKINLISVIIPTFNHGHYLHKSIESVYAQKNVDVEIIIVDDGSTDNTKQIVALHPYVKYIYQSNQGLSAARNTGIDNSTGSYLVFLDADDWLLEDALATNLAYLQEEPDSAFVSGTYQYVFEKIKSTYDIVMEVTQDHYQRFLLCNYIGMHAAVMYQRWAFDFYRFDSTLKASEDYDMFLHLARKFPVFHHTQPIAAYRIHENNMSGNIPLMLEYTLKALKRQEPLLQNENEKELIKKGIAGWKRWYCNELYKKLHPQPLFSTPISIADLKLLWKYNKSLLFKYIVKQQLKLAKLVIKKSTPTFILKQLPKINNYKKSKPVHGTIRKGDFDRTTPFSYEFGYDRGGPIDRYYIEKFLAQNAYAIKGRVLDIGDNSYTLKFGGNRVQQSDVLNFTDNPNATFIGDLSNAPQLPSQSFDCVILTQTLHLIYDYKAAIKTCHRILKPNGSLLLTVPGISNIDPDEWEEYWLWSFTKKSIERILLEFFPSDAIRVKAYGNVQVASSFLYGMGVTEMNDYQLEYNDPHYQVVITAVAKKTIGETSLNTDHQKVSLSI